MTPQGNDQTASFDADLLQAIPAGADGDEKKLLMEDMQKMKQTLKSAVANKDPDVIAKKRGMETKTMSSEHCAIKVAKLPDAADITKTINRRDLLPPPTARRPTPNGPSKPANADPDNATLLTGENDIYAVEEQLTFLVPIRRTDDPTAVWKFPPIELLRICLLYTSPSPRD